VIVAGEIAPTVVATGVSPETVSVAAFSALVTVYECVVPKVAVTVAAEEIVAPAGPCETTRS